MGYTTYFTGQFELHTPLTPEHKAYLHAFADSRRVTRNAAIAETLPDPVRIAAGLPIGPQGGYFVGTANENFGQNRDASVVDGNTPPSGQPGLWCKWGPNEDGTAIEWTEAEKFYDYVEWIEYLIAHFLGPWGYVLVGVVEWEGEESGDLGRIVITANVVTTQHGVITYV